MSGVNVWQRIANAAIRSAEEVNCSLSEFASGLEQIEEVLQERRYLVQHEEERLPREKG